ncbi:receptor-type tyrosine-protein phosphatase V-like protein [Anopheles sinensis]|uniref:Receptor-type tyrosine-protein phosphatase V-like protein n=1 Tax=Anopheles sinensis TaxID=74873 RepID=A0A084WUQ6_ANOSI|nr:receptor-type tyrosine-protein phosphatase V-like protein [Anopheles sinensis]
MFSPRSTRVKNEIWCRSERFECSSASEALPGLGQLVYSHPASASGSGERDGKPQHYSAGGSSNCADSKPQEGASDNDHRVGG